MSVLATSVLVAAGTVTTLVLPVPAPGMFAALVLLGAGTATEAALVLVAAGAETVAALVFPPAGALVLATGTAAATEEAPVPALGTTSTPHWPMGLLPGRAGTTPETTSLMALLMLQDVEGSLIPPIRPGHLSIPESPASQLSMICWRVASSQPARKSPWRL